MMIRPLGGTYHESGARLIILDAKIKSMNIGDRRRHAQAEARAGDVVAFLGAIESFEDLLPLEGRNTRPIVRHANEETGQVRFHGDTHESATWREFDRIVDKVRDCLDQKVEIAKDENWLPRFEREFDFLSFGQGS